MMRMRWGMSIGFLLSLCGAWGEPICWNDGEWDEAGRPRGKLLTDNPGWWGPSVFTGVSYSYETEPSNPRDILRGDATAWGRRLIDGDTPDGWHRPIGITRGRAVAVTFDFKRPCAFTEVDLLHAFTTAAHGSIEAGPDGTNWSPRVSFVSKGARTRVPLPLIPRGRYLRVTFKADSGNVTYLDEVLAWGGGEVSQQYPECYSPIPADESLKFTDERTGGIRILRMAVPTLKDKPKSVEHAGQSRMTLAANETEVRYFAVANAADRPRTVRLTPPEFGPGVSCELLIGGVVRMVPPKVKLTAKQIQDLLVSESDLPSGGPQRLDVCPFFRQSSKPSTGIARRYLANPEQVFGFPSGVPLGAGEGCVIMLRVTTSHARPGVRKGTLSANGVRHEIGLDIRDVILPDLPLWIHAYSPFTRQFPFESATRMTNDVRRLATLGASSCYGLARPGTKAAMFYELVPHSILAKNRWCPGRIFGQAYHGKADFSDDGVRKAIQDGARSVSEEARSLGMAKGRYAVFLPDEPGRSSAAQAGEMARMVKEVAPDVLVYENPCFWERGFPPKQAIQDELAPYYNELIDISCPIRNLVRAGNGLTETLWTHPRRVNATYIHPARRAGRSIAYLAFETGLNGFGYYCYYSPRGNPWDIRTWSNCSYDYQMVFPLENDVAPMPIYETMRDAWEDYLLLAALRRDGKQPVLKELLDAYESATDYSNVESVPNSSDFTALHDKALKAY